ncbi:Ribonuclease H [Abeliophyllum distichum]|uniref:Ribonuclease H n=1 Tax=Abeliophyllum distichum TaxID=126358 RepID=A0ABD1QEN1_9LAMI
MDAYSGYNQISMYPPDEEHTSFITDKGLYCYKVMPFSLKNAGATYQRLVNKMFADQLGSTMEVYVDDMLVKSLRAEDHIQHLQKTFQILRSYKMRLNPLKCAFGVASGKFLGFMVNQRRIEANPEKIKALVEMKSPRGPKDVQCLTGRMAALSKFVSKATDKCLPFFKVLKGGKRSRGALPRYGEARAITHYGLKEIEALLLSAQYTCPLQLSFETSYGKKIEASGRVLKWAIELSQFDIVYKPRAAIKGQALVDFVAEFTNSP